MERKHGKASVAKTIDLHNLVNMKKTTKSPDTSSPQATPFQKRSTVFRGETSTTGSEADQEKSAGEPDTKAGGGAFIPSLQVSSAKQQESSTDTNEKVEENEAQAGLEDEKALEKVFDKPEDKAAQNRDAVKEFLKENRQTLREIRRESRKASGNFRVDPETKQQMKSLRELNKSYSKAFHDKKSDFDWGTDDAVKRFKAGVATESVQDELFPDVAGLNNKFPELKGKVDYMTNWHTLPLDPLPRLAVQTLMTREELPEIVPMNVIPYGSDIRIDQPLSAFQVMRYKYGEVYAEFKKVNKNVAAYDLERWIRKQLINGWKLGDEVPNIRDIVITPVTNYWKGYPFEEWYIYTYSFDDAYGFMSSYRDKLWFWVHPITEEKKSVRQQYGSVSKYNLLHFGNLDNNGLSELYDKLHSVSKDDQLYGRLLTSSGAGSTEFIAMVKDVQTKIFGAKSEKVTGMLSPSTLQYINDAYQQKLLKQTVSFHDDRETLIAKLFYVGGDVTLYRDAIQEQLENVKNPKNKQTAAFNQLVASANFVLYGPNLMGIPNISLTPDTYSKIDAWGQKFGGNVRGMDDYRFTLVVMREYEYHAAERASLEKEIKEEQIRMDDRNRFSERIGESANTWPSVKMTELTARLKAIDINTIKAKYSHLQINALEYNYIQSNSGVTHDVSEYPLENPFGTLKGSPLPPNVTLFSMRNSLPDPKREEANAFYNNFLGRSPESVRKQVNELQGSTDLLRANLISASGSTEPLYNQLVNIYNTEKNREYPAGSIFTNNFPQNRVKSDIYKKPDDNPAGFKAAPSDRLGENYQISRPKPLAKTINQRMQEYFRPEGPSVESFKGLMSAVERMSTTKNDFYSVLHQLFAKYDGGQFIPYLKTLKYAGAIYTNQELLELAKELVDNNITANLLSQGNQDADRLRAQDERMLYLRKKAQTVGYNAVMIPAFFVLDEDIAASEAFKNGQHQIGTPGSKRVVENENYLIKHGIPLNVFLKQHNDGSYEMFVDIGNKLQREKTTANSRNEAITELFDDLEDRNVFPNGRIHYSLSYPQKGGYNINKEQILPTRSDHWQPSDIATFVAILLSVAAIPFTMGGSGVVAGGLLTASGVVGGLATGLKLYEDSKEGPLTGVQIGSAAVSILASLLPAVGKLGYFRSLRGLDSKAFLRVRYFTEGADVTIQGFTLTAEFVKEYDQLGQKSSEEIASFLFTSIAKGTLIAKSIKGTHDDLKSLNKVTWWRPRPPETMDAVTKTAETMLGWEPVEHDYDISPVPYQDVSANDARPASRPSPNKTENAPSSAGKMALRTTSTGELMFMRIEGTAGRGNAIVREYSVTQNGKTVKYTRKEFVERVRSGQYDNKQVDLIYSTEDHEVIEEMTKYFQRNNKTVNPAPEAIVPKDETAPE